MESQGLITLQTTYVPAAGVPVVIQGNDGNDDIYFHHPHRPLSAEKKARLYLSSIPPPRALHSFAAQYAEEHVTAIFARGKIHVHYCAWPIPLSSAGITFRTVEGCIYRWNVLPFDVPHSAASWQACLNSWFNNKFSGSAKFVHTTFVVCATGIEDAENKISLIGEEARKHDLKVEIPEPQLWVSDLESLALDVLWSGVQPALWKGETVVTEDGSA